MTDPNNAETPGSFADLPILPTGSGVADLEVAYEQMKLADEIDDGEDPTTDGIINDAKGYDPAVVTTDDGADTAESAAHPS